jgi:hypothetical protein
MSDEPSDSVKFSFEEYKLYYESTEKVIDRRLSLNSWNYGLCIALLGGIGAFAAWSLPRPEFHLILVAFGIALPAMGAILCSLWVGQIRDFKMLNNAKFDVLSKMAPSVRFSGDAGAISARPFEKEWDTLERLKATSETHSINIVTLKASNAEFLVPRAFSAIFVGIIAIVVAFAAINRSEISRSAFHLSSAPPSPAASK